MLRGLPAGRYVLRALSSAEKRKEFPPDKNEIDEKNADHLGLDLPFEIPASVPPEMNLGEHTLTPAAK